MAGVCGLTCTVHPFRRCYRQYSIYIYIIVYRQFSSVFNRDGLSVICDLHVACQNYSVRLWPDPSFFPDSHYLIKHLQYGHVLLGPVIQGRVPLPPDLIHTCSLLSHMSSSCWVDVGYRVEVLPLKWKGGRQLSVFFSGNIFSQGIYLFFSGNVSLSHLKN